MENKTFAKINIWSKNFVLFSNTGIHVEKTYRKGDTKGELLMMCKGCGIIKDVLV